MAQIVTITNPLTGQPTQVDQLEHTAQQIDDGIGFESTDYPGCYYRMVGGVVEWFNPPMMLASINDDGSYINEYRTTERYLGKPVYAIALNFGPPPQSGDGKLAWNKLPNLNRPISCQAIWGSTVLPYDDGEGLNMRVRSLSNSNIVVNANYDWTSAGLDIIVVIKYWKTTD